MPRSRVQLRIDNQPDQPFASAPVGTVSESLAPPAPRYIAPPTGLVLTTGLTQSDRSAFAYIGATWDVPAAEAQEYEIRFSIDSSFATNVAVVRALVPSATLQSLKPGTSYTVQVRAVYREAVSDWTAAATITTPLDTTPPSLPSSVTATIGANGDLMITGTNPGEANFARVLIAVRGSSVGPLYALLDVPGQPGAAFRLVWPAAENVRLSGGGDGTLDLSITSQNWSGYSPVSALSLTPSKAAPTAPAITATWDGAAGWLMFSGSYDTQTALALTLDGVTRIVTLPYAYDLATNRREHSGTAAASIAWSASVVDALNQASAATSGTATLARPATPSGVSATWDGASGTCTFVWSPVGSVATYRLTIDTIARSIGDTRYAYGLGQNRQEHGGVADPVLDWALVAVDGLGQTSTTAATGTATLARPATPGSVVTDFASATAVWQWGVVSAIVGYRLTIDGIVRDLVANRYDYGFALNIQEHSGTPDPVLTWSLVAVDALGQTSTTPASGTLTNPVPSAPTAISIIGGATGFFVSITPAVPSDFRDYTVRIMLNSATLETITRTTSAFAYQAAGSGTYTVGVIVNDAFNQASTEYVTPTGAVVDVLLPAELRADCVYMDSIATASATLAGLKDDNRTTNVVTYASGTPWKWTEAKRSGATRVGNLAITATAGVGYVGISEDGITYTWFSGPLAADLETLTQVASEAAAQTTALALPTTATGVWRLPTTASARYIRLGHRNTSATYTLREFYPPTLVVADNIRAGLIRGMRVVANQLVADELAAISAALGAVDLSGVCTIGINGGIWQGSAGTFASPTTGYKQYRSATGKGLWETWLAGVRQVYLDDDMSLYAGTGNVRLDALGMQIYGVKNIVGFNAFDTAIRWYANKTDAQSNWRMAIYYAPSEGNVINTIGGFAATIRNYQTKYDFGPITFDVGFGNTSTTRYTRMDANGIVTRGNGTPNPAARASIDSADGNVIANTNGAMIGNHPSYTGYAAFWQSGFDYTILSDGANTFLNVPSASGSIFFRAANSNLGYFDSAGNLSAKGSLYASNQGTSYLSAGTLGLGLTGYYTNNSFQTGGNVAASGDIYLGTRSTYLSAWLNQSVTSGAVPTFGGVYVTGRVIADSDNNAGGGSGAAALNFAGGGEAIGSPRAVGASNQYGLDFYTAGVCNFAIASSGVMSMGGGAIGSYGLTANQRLRIHSTGDTSTHIPLAVVSSAGTTTQMYVRGDGYGFLNATAWAYSSDRRLKRNIRDLSNDWDAAFMALRPRRFDYKRGAKREIGFIAQEVQPLFPDFVTTSVDGMLGLKTTNLIPLLVAKVQQLERRVHALEGPTL